VSWRVDGTAPDTRIDSGPPPLTRETTARLTFSSPDADASRFECSLDGAAFNACNSPRSYTALAPGEHRFSVRAVDAAGNADLTPATHDWRIPPQVVPLIRDVDNDGVPDATDNCRDRSNADQGDTDGDKVGNACELLPDGKRADGTTPVVAGSTAVVELLSGEVFVKLPAGTPASTAMARRRAGASQTAPLPGYVPLKGIAAVPVGSTVDARKGRVSLTTAADYKPAGAPRRRTQSGTFSAALFAIRQARAKRAAVASRPRTDLVLQSPPGVNDACTGRTPLKGVLRTLTGTAKGNFRAIGAASTTTITDATWITQDRCDGTLTEVGRGKASVFDRSLKRAVIIRAGQAYLAKARLFSARSKRGRPAPARRSALGGGSA
jgi:hypothetical protein